MKMLVASDIHGNYGIAQKLAVIATNEEVEAILILGDITHFGSFEDAEYIMKLFSDTEIETFYIPGNVDPKTLVKKPIELPYVHLAHGKGYEIADLTIVGAGGSIPTPFNTSIEFSEDNLEKIIENGIKDIDNKKINVLMTHVPPYGTALDLAGKIEHVGSKVVRKTIEKYQPTIALSGHIHESRAIDRIERTLIINPGAAALGYYALIEVTDESAEGELKIAI